MIVITKKISFFLNQKRLRKNFIILLHLIKMSRLEIYNSRRRSLIPTASPTSLENFEKRMEEKLEKKLEERLEQRLEEYLPKQDFNRRELQIINTELKTFYDKILYLSYYFSNKLNSKRLFFVIMGYINTYAINGAYYYYNGITTSTNLFFKMQNIEMESVSKKANVIVEYINDQDILTKINLFLSNANIYKDIAKSVSQSINLKPVFNYITNAGYVMNILSDIWNYLLDFILRRFSYRKGKISLTAEKYLETIKNDILKQIKGRKSSFNLNKIIPSSTSAAIGDDNVEEIYRNNLNYDFFDKPKTEVLKNLNKNNEVEDIGNDYEDENEDDTMFVKKLKEYITFTEDRAVKFNRIIVLEEVESLANIITESMPRRYLNLQKSYLSHTETLDDTIDIVLVSGLMVVIFFLLISMFKNKMVSKIKLRINKVKQERLTSSHTIEYIEDGRKRKSFKRKSVKRKSVKRKN